MDKNYVLFILVFGRGEEEQRSFFSVSLKDFKPFLLHTYWGDGHTSIPIAGQPVAFTGEDLEGIFSIDTVHPPGSGIEILPELGGRIKLGEIEESVNVYKAFITPLFRGKVPLGIAPVMHPVRQQ